MNTTMLPKLPIGKSYVRVGNYGDYAIVDNSDLPIVEPHAWYLWDVKGRKYAFAKIKSDDGFKQIKMHRLILGLSNPKIFVDHKDHNGLNNSRDNMRECSAKENSRNRISTADSTSKFLGVHISNKKAFRKKTNKTVFYKYFVSRINFGGKCIHIGLYKDETEAALAYDKKAIELFGEFANLNFKA